MENFTVLNESNASSIFMGGVSLDDDHPYSSDLSSSSSQDHLECMAIDSVESIGQFLKCFKHFVSRSVLTSCLVLAFAFATVVLNLAVVAFIYRLKAHKTVFDRIFIGHCLVDCLVGLLVIPNYCIYIVFGYWPLGKLLCHFYVSLDYTICHVGILHMVFVAYARLRSLQAPKKYHNEWIILHAKLTMLVLWIISGLLWLPAVNLIINLSFKNRECYFTYHPIYIIIQDSIAYLLPMLIILGITGYILRTLHLRNKRRKRLRRKKHMRLPKLVAQERQRVLMSKGAQSTPVVLKITENFSTSDADGDASDYSDTVVVGTAAAQSTLSPTRDELTTRLDSSTDEVRTTKPAKNNINRKAGLSKQVSNLTSTYESSYTGLNSLEDESSLTNDKQTNSKIRKLKRRIRKVRCSIKLNAYAKLYMIIATFCILWLPFCVLWPINAVCETCISSFVYQLSYWMGYGQSLINPILLLILNPNYNKLKSDA